MGVIDLLQSFMGRGEGRDPGLPKFGSVAKAYIETGEAPDESWRAVEGPNGELDLVVTVEAEPGHWPTTESITAVEREIRTLGGTVENTTDTGVLLAELPKTQLAALAKYDRVRQLEVTRTIDD